MRRYWLLLILSLISIVHVYADDALSDSLRSGIKQDDVFVRLIFSEQDIYKKKAVTLTYRLYSNVLPCDMLKMEYPKFEGFKVKEIELPYNRQLQSERYNDVNYYTLELRQLELTPKQSGKKTIQPSIFRLVLKMPSGQYTDTVFFGKIETNQDVEYEFTSPALELDILSPNKIRTKKE